MSDEKREVPMSDDRVEGLEDLGAKELAAMGAMTSGGSVAAAAKAAGVHRSTVYLWLEEGKPLRMALDAWKRDLVEVARNRLLLLTSRATVAVADAIERGDERMAMRLLEKLGVMAAPPVGPTGYELQQREKQIRVEAGERKYRREKNVDLFFGDWDGEEMGLPPVEDIEAVTDKVLDGERSQ